MIEKRYLSANELLIDSFKLAEKIYLSGYKPDFIIGIWRGGTPIAIAIQEHLEVTGIETNHIAIKTHSYTGINEQRHTVEVTGLEYLKSHVTEHHNLLLVDDVFDSGRSVDAIFHELQKELGEQYPTNIKVACPWYKPNKNMTTRVPDYYLHETDEWLVFPHELKGLTPEEIKINKPNIAETITKHLKE